MRVFYLHALPSLSTSIQSRMFWYTEVNMHMFRSRVHIMSLVILACFAVGTALAQNQAQPQSTKPPATSTPKMEDVSKCTQKHWHAAKPKTSQPTAKRTDFQNKTK